MSEQGKSRTRELLWSWAQRNGTVGDLVHILQEMDHQRAIQVFRQQGAKQQSLISYPDIIEGTRNFHQDLKIGEGAFSEVYRAVMRNQAYAVKLFKQMVNNADAWELADESRARSGAKQQSLISYPDIIEGTRNFHQDLKIGEGAFSEVYRAVMRNQAYAVKLFKQDNPTLLPWETRLNIVKGTAQAIQYLHTAQPCAVICGNITSANILLDERFEPKLCDFGMASLRPHTFNQSSTISLDPGTRRAWGYQPEEYIRDGKLSVKLDVYSFGVVLDVLSELNPACYSAEDQPHTLKDMEPPPLTYAQPHMSLPVENDEIQDFHFQTPELNTDGSHQREQGRAQKSPCECSQSQVMFRGSDSGMNAKGSEAIAGKSPNSVWRFLLPGSGAEDWPVSQRLPGSYCSRAVECSCASEEAGGECEECRASGFLLTTPVTPRGKCFSFNLHQPDIYFII
ncbi:Interleukin-1 receptor-associated kinase 3 [Acipenser ruthenus]|uniref:Interleukin-1 receptor-associated kinase 3 n=1 Tax=Acipenser ruthenus TaxID=7906 RepID=A0A662YN39_ACIRT|nr:Interleukin-1 receptor-associated kinase 3 [Acipenser ruthenus]